MSMYLSDRVARSASSFAEIKNGLEKDPTYADDNNNDTYIDDNVDDI